ncbi:branched-chain amino acid aminotransferase [Reticulomyxa filosa]|uniref:branched-chain-amino-acid transaminase n=1 Tax=Reticulomyxa filosa TaxID=46433 RepID=X6PF01_RETFI|nr:branched-chain amino acid aminotransferase [Reticulomyxa filosa]|eukprot:ETO36257.1 branched-chain amino acid aminotransferase [Reticulomyxa filosa]
MRSLSVFFRARLWKQRIDNVLYSRYHMPINKRLFSLTSKPLKSSVDIDSKKLIIQKTTSPKKKTAYEQLIFGHEFTDHMLEIDWDQVNGWHEPIIRPYGPLSLEPSASVLHYAIEAFEGLKAYVDATDPTKIRLFRPDQNVNRLLNSCTRLALPSFNGDEFLKCLYTLLHLDRSWVPSKDNYSLYIRPNIISTHPFIGIAPSQAAKLYVILSPVGPHYREGFKPVSLYCTQDYVRAWPKGTGSNKLGLNYAPTIVPQLQAAEKGYSQVMWLFGTMNQFFFWINEKKEKELITCPLDGSILPGVTRDSILKICKDWNEFKVTERPFTMKEVTKAITEGRMLESFGAGTASIISPIKLIHYKGKDYNIPLNPQNPNENAGPLARKLFKAITDIQKFNTLHHVLCYKSFLLPKMLSLIDKPKLYLFFVVLHPSWLLLQTQYHETKNVKLKSEVALSAFQSKHVIQSTTGFCKMIETSESFQNEEFCVLAPTSLY